MTYKAAAIKQPGSLTMQVGLALLAVLLVLLAVMLYQWHSDTELLRSMVVPVDNGDIVCDEVELATARAVDKTPCGQYLHYLVSVNQSI